jgi:hypothetical protein
MKIVLAIIVGFGAALKSLLKGIGIVSGPLSGHLSRLLALVIGLFSVYGFLEAVVKSCSSLFRDTGNDL